MGLVDSFTAHGSLPAHRGDLCHVAKFPSVGRAHSGAPRAGPLVSPARQILPKTKADANRRIEVLKAECGGGIVASNYPNPRESPKFESKEIA